MRPLQLSAGARKSLYDDVGDAAYYHRGTDLHSGYDLAKKSNCVKVTASGL